MKKLIMTLLIFTISLGTFSQTANNTLKDDSFLYDFAQQWVGTKYKTGGESKKGVDCSGFSRILYSTIYNHQLPRTAREQYKHTTRVKKSDLEPGDLVFFRVKTRTTWHVGVYLSDDLFVHAANRRKGVIVSSLDDSYYRKTFVSGGRTQGKNAIFSGTVLYNQFRDYVEWLQEQETKQP